MDESRQPTSCENLNHRRSHAPVRHCPGCGGIVNKRVAPRQCSPTEHATARRERQAFCIDCGMALVVNN